MIKLKKKKKKKNQNGRKANYFWAAWDLLYYDHIYPAPHEVV
jgi:hypothetical protein